MSAALVAATPQADIKLTCFHANVYEPAEDSFALVDALRADAAQLRQVQSPTCLEIGCGTGFVITSLARLLQHSHPVCIATDINSDAAQATRATLSQHGVHAEVVITDLVGGLHDRLHGRVDVMVFNPPYVPSPPEEVGGSRLCAAWAGGHRGREVIDRLLPLVPPMLSPGGVFYMVTITANDVDDVTRTLEALGMRVRVALTRKADEEHLHVLAATRA